MSPRALGARSLHSRWSLRGTRLGVLALLLPLAAALSATTLVVPGPAGDAALALATRHAGATRTTTTSTSSTTVPGTSVASTTAPASTTTTSDPSSGGGQNLLVGDQATFSGTTGGWVGGAATLAWAASPASTSDGSLAITSTSTAAPAASSGSPQNGTATPATPGAVYRATAALESAGTTLDVQPALVFYSSTGSMLTAVFGQRTPIGQGAFTSLAPALAIAPPSTASVTLTVVVSSSTSGQTVFLEQPSLTTAPAGAPTVLGPLSTVGNQILQANGAPFVAQGFTLPGLSNSASPAGLTQNTVLQAKAWGANLIRVPLGEQLWLSSSCAYSPDYRAEVENVVNWITSQGMVALLELAFNNPADIDVPAGGSCPAAHQQIMADQASVPFWSQVAADFATNPLVAFDLYNEPQNIPGSVWLNGGTVGTYQAAGMQTMYDAVRAAGAPNLVVVSGDNWANSPPPQDLVGPDIAYAVHVYTCPAAPPPYCANSNPYDPSPILDRWVTPSASIPVIVSEFGWPSPSDGTYNAAVIAFARAHGWGWLDFAWTTTQPWNLLVSRPQSGPAEPAPSGMPALAAMAGLPWP